MAKKQIYLGFEVKKKGKGLFVDCATVIGSRSREEAKTILREYADMNPIAILTDKEASEMFERLKALFNPVKFDKKHEKRLLEKIRKAEKAGSKG